MRVFMLVLIMITISSCKKEPAVLNSFGKVKLGMTVKEFENEFPKDTLNKSYKTWLWKRIDTLQIMPNIAITNVSADFTAEKLVSISCDYNKDLIKILKKNYGIANADTISKDYNFVNFKTNSKDIQCGFESYGNRKILGLLNLPEVRKRNKVK